MKKCVNCNIEFETNKKNQKYCTPSCCRIATNKKIMEKYYENKKRLSGQKRYCSCGQLLSRYNENFVCFVCDQKNKNNDKKNILEVINSVAKKTGKAKR
jgi:uncharacterized paraquat-inducible protein A